MNFTTQLALHSQATRLLERTSYAQRSSPKTGFSPSMMPHSKGLLAGLALRARLQTTSPQVVTPADFKFELFPLHSPLLGESLLVSFPPLIQGVFSLQLTSDSEGGFGST